MKKILITILLSILLLSGCNSEQAEVDIAEDNHSSASDHFIVADDFMDDLYESRYYNSGVIEEIVSELSTFFLEGDPGRAYNISEDVTVVEHDGAVIALDELEVGMKVHIYTTGFVSESYPAQLQVKKITIAE